MKRLLPLLLSLCLLCAGCSSPSASEQKDNTLHILATTYPVYLFARTITEGVDGVEVTRLITQEISCLHDYTLTVSDMKAIERADVILLSGAGLEAFMDDALAQSQAAVVDCSQGITLLHADSHDHSEADEQSEDYDPHFWLDESDALIMLRNIWEGLAALDGAHQKTYEENYNSATQLLPRATLDATSLSCPYLITFHDGFQYFAQANGLTLLKAIEEEEGSEASAAEIKEIVELIEEYQIPAIFTEKNGSDATAQAISRETGAAVYQLDTVMSGNGEDLTAYIEAMDANYAVIREALS